MAAAMAASCSAVTASAMALRAAAAWRAKGLPGPPLLPAANRPLLSRPPAAVELFWPFVAAPLFVPLIACPSRRDRRAAYHAGRAAASDTERREADDAGRR